MKRKRRTFTAEVKAKIALEAMKGEKTINEIAQPSYDERQRFLKGLGSLLPGSKIEMKDLFAQPGHGNYVNHERLFTEAGQRRAATPISLWRMSPHIFKEQANRISRTVMLRVQANQGLDALHPACLLYTSPSPRDRG